MLGRLSGWDLYVRSEGEVRPEDWEATVRDYAEWLSRSLGVRVLVNEDAVKGIKEMIRRNGGLNHCPCTMVFQPASLCPCNLAAADLRVRGVCFCGLFYIHSDDMERMNEEGLRKINSVFKVKE